MDLLTYVTIGAGVVSTAATLLAMTKPGRRRLKKWWEKRKRYAMVPDILEKIQEKLDKCAKRQEELAKELKTNGGSSIKDEVRLLVTERLMELQEAPYPAFRTTSGGLNIFVNRAYETLVDAEAAQIHGQGWRQFIHDPSQGDDYFNRWVEVSESNSHFAGLLKFKDLHGNYRGEWLVRIAPLGSFREHDKIWGGRFYPHDDVAIHVADAYGWDKRS